MLCIGFPEVLNGAMELNYLRLMKPLQPTLNVNTSALLEAGTINQTSDKTNGRVEKLNQQSHFVCILTTVLFSAR
jgi:hypothetical protein